MEDLLAGCGVTVASPSSHPGTWASRNGQRWVVVTLGWLAHAGSTILRLKFRCLGKGVGTQTLGNGDLRLAGLEVATAIRVLKQIPALTGTAAELAVSTRRKQRTVVLESLSVFGDLGQEDS